MARDDFMQFGGIDRLGQVRVATSHLSANAVKRRRFAGEHDDRQRCPGASACLDAAAGFEAIHARHQDIHQYAGERFRPGGCDTALGGAGLGNFNALPLQQRTQIGPRGQAVVDDENAPVAGPGLRRRTFVGGGGMFDLAPVRDTAARAVSATSHVGLLPRVRASRFSRRPR